MKSFHWLLAALVALPPSALAADKHATAATIGKKQASLTLSDAACADNAECVDATFSCEDGGFAISVNGVETSDAGALLKDRKGAASLTADAKTFSFIAAKLELSEMDGAWEVNLANRENPGEAWKALASAQRITLSVGGHKLAFAGDKNVAKVAKTCAK